MSSLKKISVQNLCKYGPFVEALGEGTLIPFCGAGLSSQCPSHIPLAWDLKRSIFGSLCKGNEILNQICKSFSSTSLGGWSLSQLPLEFLLEASYAEGMRNFDRILAFMREAKPSWTHKTIKSILELGVWSEILTTNFDSCFEKSAPDNYRKVIHLHGSIENPKSLVLTIERIGMGLPHQLAEHLRKLHRSKNMFFIGYSGYDADVLDVLESIDGKPVYWLCMDNQMAGVSIRAKEFIKRVDGVSIIGDLQQLLNEIRILTHLPEVSHGQCRCIYNWQQHVSNGIEYFPLGDRARFVARICLEGNDLDNAIKAYSLAIKASKSDTLKAKALCNLAFVYYMKRDMEKVRTLSLRGRELGLRSKNARFIAAGLNNIGLSFLDGNKDEICKALSYFQEAVYINEKLANNGYRRNNNLRAAAQSLNNIGLVYTKLKRYKEAKDAFLRSIAIKEEYGDLIGKAISSANLSQLECEEGDWIIGFKRHEESIDILLHFSKLISVGYFRGKMGICLANMGRYEEAEKLLEEAVTIYKSVNGPKNELCEFKSKLALVRQN